MDRASRGIRWLSICLIIFAIASPTPAQKSTTRAPVPQNVLLVMPPYTGRRGLSLILDGIQGRFAQLAGERISVTVEAISLTVLDKPDLEQLELERFRKEYGDQNFDLIMVVGAPCMRFVNELRPSLWAGVPLVFSGIDRTAYSNERQFARTTGVFSEYDWAGDVQLAKELFPGTRHIALVAGGSSFERMLTARLGQVVREQNPAIEFIDLSDHTFAQQLSLAATLPPDTVLMLGPLLKDVAGHSAMPGPNGFRGLIAQSANAPLLHSDLVGYRAGGLGGSLIDYEALGREAADLGSSVLNGATSPDAPPTVTHSYQTRLDWRELKRWNVPISHVPAGVAIDNRPTTLWHEHRNLVLLVAGAILLQSLLIGVLLYERRGRRLAQVELGERLRFETLLSHATASFASLSGTDQEKAILICLQQVKDFFGADRASVWVHSNTPGVFMRSLVWPDAGTGILSVEFAAGFRNTILRLMGGDEVYFSNPAEMALLEDADAFRGEGVRSFLAIPLREKNSVVGALSIASVEKEMNWPKEIVYRLRTVADLLGSALARNRAEKGLHESELLMGSILASIRSSVAVVDCDGVIIEVNQKWNSFGADNGSNVEGAIGIGVNYLDVCRKASINDREARRALEGILSVLNGTLELFELEYPCPTPEEYKWFRMTVDRLNRPQGGAVISHLDVTERKKTELERTRALDEIAHMNRVASMGHMAASLAHELAQPLAAILMNTQAAERFAKAENPNISEICEALADIREDDRRAGAVLQNIRSIMKKATISAHALDLNGLVESVAGFVRNDALLRSVQLRVQLSPGGLPVRGDDVPLQQVLLNLMNNGMDAMHLLPSAERILTVSTGSSAAEGAAWVVVEDEGPGVPEEIKQRLFTPFFTTKKDGLGMGLSICRVIMESLGGSVTLESRPGRRGTAFRVELRLASPEPSEAAIEVEESGFPIV
jgi:signal transduction histidine kinase